MERGHKAEDTKEKVEQESNIPKKSCFKKTQNNNNVHLDNILQQIRPKRLPNNEKTLVYFEDKRKVR